MTNKINKEEIIQNFMDFEVLKGTKDYEPKDMIKANLITDTIKRNFESFGFRPFDTPMIEYFDTLTNKYDEDAEIVQEVFKVTDRGERKLGLRYDLTIPLCRFIAGKKQLKLPFRRYHIGKAFRDGPVKVGRLREFIQCDADVVGIKGQEIEAELLEMFYNSYQELNIKSFLEINNNKILKGAFLQEGFKEEDLDILVLAVDKLKKIGETGVLKEIDEKGLNSQNARNSIKILTSKTFEEIKSLATNEILIQGIEELETLVNYIKDKVNIKVNFSMSRGHNYYTGNIWEMFDESGKVTSSIGSGGRYDKGIGNYIDDGNEYPAVGVSFGLVGMIACLENQENFEEKEGLTDILIVPLENSQEIMQKTFEISSKLRKEENKNVEIYYGYKLNKAFKYSDYLGVEEIVAIGNKDLESGVLKIKNLKTKKEREIEF